MRNVVKSNWFPISSGLACFIWAFLAWLTVIPNQDLLADGIQVQSLISDPRIVLAFPGQKHGGVFEYPYNVLAEWIAPGNYFLESALRPLFAFLTGFLAAKLYLTYFPRGPRWSFLLAVAVGPTILHGLAGPEGNSVGVWWLNANYDLAWLFVILGFWLIGRELSGPVANQVPRTGMLFFGGVLLGLGFYQQPTSILLILPLGVLLLLRFRISLSQFSMLLLGGFIGILPAILSYFYAPITTWNPSHFPVFQLHLALASLGLDGVPNYAIALLPSALGFAPATTIGFARLQTVVSALFLSLMLILALVGTFNALRRRSRVSEGTAIAVCWIAVAGSIVIFGIFVDPVWFYSSHLSIVLWMSIGILPQLIKVKWISRAAPICICLVVALSSLAQNGAQVVNLKERFMEKREYISTLNRYASAMRKLETRVLYGSYYDVLPIAYGAAGSLHPVTSTYNRFPLSGSALAGLEEVKVGIRTDPTDEWGIESLDEVRRMCLANAKLVTGKLGTFQVFDCPVSVIKRQ